jgi:branched-chain amino acid transport system substrate-binding protein
MNKLLLGAVLLMTVSVNAADTIKIGVVGPRTGPAAAEGQAFDEGIALALDKINAGGGLLGKRVEVVFEDTAGDPEKAAAGFERLITRDHAVMVVGESHSSPALAEIEVANRLQVPFIVSEAWHDDITKKGYRWVFRAGPVNSGVVNNTIAKFVKDAGFKKAVIIAENSDWGKGIGALTVAALDSYKISNVLLPVASDAKDFYTELTKLKGEKPDITLAYVYSFGLHSLVSQAKEVGLSGLILDGAGPPSVWPEFWKNVGDAGNGELFVSSMHEKVHLTKASREFWDAYRKKFGKAPSDFKSRSLYNSVLIAADAVRRAKSTEGEPLVAALEKTDLEVTTGRVRFGLKPGTYEYHQWMPPMLVVQWQGKDNQVVVYPPPAVTGKLQKPR